MYEYDDIEDSKAPRWYKTVILLISIGLLWFYRIQILNFIGVIWFIVYYIYCQMFGIPLQIGP
jgi:hypothetical protein